MTDLAEAVLRLEQAGGTLVLAGDQIRYSVPSEDAEARALLSELRKHREKVRAFLRARAAIPVMPPGVCLLSWNLKDPPIGIETCAIVTDPALFVSRTLEQLRIALAQPKRWVGWSVPQLIDRLGQCGVIVSLEEKGKQP